LTDDQIGEYIEAWDRILGEAVADERPDIIHVQYAWVIPSCVRRLHIPYVLTVHGTELMGIRNDERYHDMVRDGVEGASTLIMISGQVSEDAMALLHIPRRKVQVIHGGFDAHLFRPGDADRPQVLARYRVRPDVDSVVAFVGQLAPFKGVDTLLRAAALYEKELGSVATLVVGAGDQEAPLKALAGELALQAVHFLGHLPQEEVADIYNIADVTAVPSRVEPFGVVAVESLACGTPVVATREGGLPDFINERVGALVDVDDPAQLAKAIAGEIVGGTKSTKGPAAARYALENFQWRQVARRVEWIYEEALKMEV
ncbi:MAG: glycosyltransferase, partial [Pseudomonadota bacterium]